MAELLVNERGGYRYVKGVFQYSAGVAALPGHRIERARFRAPVPLAQGFREIEAHLKALDRPMSALCACELRSPAPFTEDGFADFNREYVGPLARWGVLQGELNPIARTNVCPEVGAPETPSFYAFSYTVPADARTPGGFVASGSGEAPEGKGNYRDHVIRLGDRSTDGLRAKAKWVCEEMERRMAALGFGWGDATGTHLYTVYDIHPFLADELVRRGAARAGLNWHYSRPPVAHLDYEMDVRGVYRELVL
jgi:hypothetical protein